MKMKRMFKKLLVMSLLVLALLFLYPLNKKKVQENADKLREMRASQK